MQHTARTRRLALGAGLALAAFSAQPQNIGLPNLSNLRLPGAPAQQQAAPSGDNGKLLSQIGGCAVGGAAGAAVGNMLGKKAAAAKPGSDAGKQAKGAAILGGLTGCAAGAAIAGGIYDRLSEQGRQNRERELAEAARSAQVRTYKDPQNPSLSGTVTPGPVYVDTASSRECRNIEDTLADSGKGEPVVVKYCRTPPDTKWASA